MRLWLFLPILALLVPGCADPFGCQLVGSTLSWSEDTPWALVPGSGTYGPWTLQRDSNPYPGLPIDHTKTPGWEADEGLPLQELWWRSPLAVDAAPADLQPFQAAPPGWITLDNEGYGQPDGSVVRQIEARMLVLPGMTENQTREAFGQFLHLVLEPEVAAKPFEVHRRDTSAGSFFLVEDIAGPFGIEPLYVDLVRPLLVDGDLGDTFEPPPFGVPDPPLFVPLDGWVFQFAEQQVEASGEGFTLHLGSQGEASLFAEGRRVGEHAMRGHAADAFAALGLGSPAFARASHHVVRRCPSD